jgi:uncharacterized phage protein (TIGR01671 family)
MKREIKFRAWNKSKKKMYGSYAYFDKQGILHGSLTVLGGTYIPLQYTSLKDKHGKEIAEADIVKNKFELLYEVRFGEFSDTKWHVQNGFYLYDFEDKIGRGNMGYNVDESCPLEVIGNIYENPDLLNSD